MIVFLLIAYGLVALVVWRVVGGYLAWQDVRAGERPEGDDYGFGAVIGLFIAAAWPPVVIGLLLWQVIGRLAGRVSVRLLSPAEQRGRIKRLEAEAREHERKIEQLERETGVSP